MVKRLATWLLLLSMICLTGCGDVGESRTSPPLTSESKAAVETGHGETWRPAANGTGKGKADPATEKKINVTDGEGKRERIILISVILIGASAAVIGILILVSVKKSKKRASASGGAGTGVANPMRTMPAVGGIAGLFGGYAGRVYPLDVEKICVIGRGSSCNIQILHRNVSRVHCTVQFIPDGQYLVVDRSSNGTYHGDLRLERGKPYTIPPGSLLVIGDADNVLQLQVPTRRGGR